MQTVPSFFPLKVDIYFTIKEVQSGIQNKTGIKLWFRIYSNIWLYTLYTHIHLVFVLIFGHWSTQQINFSHLSPFPFSPVGLFASNFSSLSVFSSQHPLYFLPNIHEKVIESGPLWTKFPAVSIQMLNTKHRYMYNSYSWKLECLLPFFPLQVLHLFKDSSCHW